MHPEGATGVSPTMRRLTVVLLVLAALGLGACGAPPAVDGDGGALLDGGADAGRFDAGAEDAGGQDDAGVADGGADDGGTEDAGADGGEGSDAGTGDAGASDAGAGDAGAGDGGASDAGAGDAGSSDAGGVDGGGDAGPADAGAGTDGGGATDAGAGGSDAGLPPVDAGSPYPGGCVSGVTGHYAARFHWAGNGSGSTAYVQYDMNNFPDASRWRAGAYSRGSIGYTPVFVDVFLGAGGLQLGSSNFMDVQLSTAGLTTIRHVWLALKGRSYNTTASGSFSWLSFDGSGATPSGFVSNAAPYQWYVADATSAFVPGNASVLVRIEPGPPSGSLVVNAVEFCIDGE